MPGRIDAVLGRTLVLQVEVDDERAAARRGVKPRLDDGRVLRGELFWIGVRLRPPSEAGPAWLPATRRWRAIAIDDITPAGTRPVGGWHLVLDLPIDAVGQGLWFGKDRFEINWLPDPISIAAHRWLGGQAPAGLWQSPASADALDSIELRRMLQSLATSPLHRWRAKLVRDGLRPTGRLGQVAREGPVRSIAELRFELYDKDRGGEVLDALAAQIEARWQVALGWLWLADEDTHAYVRNRLAGVALIYDKHVPAWDLGTLPIDSLLTDMLDPFVDGPTKAMRARAWADSGPRALAWVIDDGGTQDATTGGMMPTIGVISLPKNDRPAAIAVEGNAAGAALEPIEPRALRPVRTAMDPVEPMPGQRGMRMEPVRVRVGRWSRELSVIAGAVPASPPGLRLGPLLHDWTLAALSTGRAELGALPPESRSTVATLSKRSVPGQTGADAGWTLYVECLRPDESEVSAAPSRADEITVWLGSLDRPAAVLRITPDGRVADELAEGRGVPSAGASRVEVFDRSDRWVFSIDLPPTAVDSGGVLRVGLERTDGWGRHTAWPRRMLPWQEAPGRLAVNAKSWDGLGE